MWGEAVHVIVVPRRWRSRYTPSDIIAHCRNLIAGYKCPHSVVIRSDQCPYLEPAKSSKSTLRAPYWEGRERIVQANVQ